jgi:beta-N-acetylhexosaminidase
MSLEERALRCVLPGFAGTEAPDWVRRRAGRGLGGVVLFARNVESNEQVRRLASQLHAERPDLVVAVDEEGGDVTRIEARTGSSYPGNLALGAAGDPALTTEVAAAMGAELAALGIDLDLGPVADVNSNPLNPVIGVRSFGSDPHLVARQTAAWIAGMQGAGVAACAKHFPGHGDTAVDSHLALPVAGEDPRLGALEPFKAAIAAEVRAIMSAHIVAPMLDDLPATISPRIMTGLLRDELGFEGVAVSDGLEMAGLTALRTVPEAAVLALAAGCDALCVGGGLDDEATLDAIVAAIVRAVQDGRLPEERLSIAASRMERLKNFAPPLVGESPAQRAEGEGASQKAARQAIQTDGDVRVGDEATVIRLDSSQSIPAGTVPWGMAGALAARGVRVADGLGRVVIAVRSLHRQPENRSQVDDLLRRHPDAVLVEMGVPACRPPGARAYIATHGSARVLADAAADVMTRP